MFPNVTQSAFRAQPRVVNSFVVRIKFALLTVECARDKCASHFPVLKYEATAKASMAARSRACSPLLPHPCPHNIVRHRGDSQSCRYESKLSVTYREHPQRDGLPVVGEVAYPNLDFEYTKVRWGVG